MGCFCYKGADIQGRSLKGSVEAAGYLEAVQELRQQGIMPIKVFREGVWHRLKRLFREGNWALWSSREAFVIGFCKEMSLMLEAGLPMDQAAVVAVSGGGTRYQQLGIRLADSLKRGYTLSESMKLAQGGFSPFVIAITRAGEMSGNLPEALESLHKVLEQNHAAAKKLRGALTYPGFLCILSLGMVMLLIHQVLPVFATVFAAMDVNLPWITELLLGLGDNLPKLVLYACGGILGLVVLTKALGSNRYGSMRLDRLKLKLPVVGRLWWQQEQAVFFGTMSMLIGSGIRINHGLELLGNMCTNTYLRFVYESMRLQISQGHSFAKCLKGSGLYSPMIEAMAEAGERTGELATMLDYAGKICQGEADGVMDNINTMAEPVIILMLGLIVGFIVMSTILPILDLMMVF